MKRANDRFWSQLWREALRALSLGWDLAVPIFGGVLLGHFLDRLLGTRPTFTIGLLVMGIAIGYYNIARFIQRFEKREKERSAENEDTES